MVSLLSEPAETWFGSVLLLTIVAVIVRATFCWRADDRMNFLVALLRECPADDLGEGSSDLPTVALAEAGRRG
jgi:hypothetical protein